MSSSRSWKKSRSSDRWFGHHADAVTVREGDEGEEKGGEGGRGGRRLRRGCGPPARYVSESVSRRSLRLSAE
eukprot:355105-Chlamydomonas_euryale.AAC.7